MTGLKVHLYVFGYGGLHARTFTSLFDELTSPSSGCVWHHRVVTDDALIDRSRSRALSSFLRAVDPGDDHAAFAMVDHDVAWQIGDVACVARTAAWEDAVVGGLYACRGLRAGFSSRLEARGELFQIGGPRLHEAQYVATGFMAGSVSVVRRVLDHCRRPDVPAWAKVTECLPLVEGDGPWWDFFRPVPLPETLPGREGQWNYMSEDWAFCARARLAGVRLYVSETPRLVHYGQFGFLPQHGLKPEGGSTNE